MYAEISPEKICGGIAFYSGAINCCGPNQAFRELPPQR